MDHGYHARYCRRKGDAMTSVQERELLRSTKALDGLRANSFAAIVMLLLEFGLGVGVNLYATLPTSDHGRALLPAFGNAVTGGPAILATHALLGTVLLITGVSAVVRASLLRRIALIEIASVSLLAIVDAWLSGARFVGTMANGASLAMAVATGVSLLCYALILLIAPRSPMRERTS